MPKARRAQVSLEATPYYHCISRCVRRAFLCGIDTLTGQDYEHRRQWIEDRLLELSSIFAIDIAAYAIMNNHYHVVIHVDRERSEKWSTNEVCTRWHQLFSGNDLSRRYIKQEVLSASEDKRLLEQAEDWRKRLIDISWFMRCLNDKIIRNDFEQLCWP